MTVHRTAATYLFAILAALPVAASDGGAVATESAEPAPLTGWVDMHTHPMAHLGFGGKLLHGSPDLGIVMSAIPIGSGCDHYRAPIDRIEASREDRAIHGGYGLFDNTCGDTLRKEFLRGLESALGAQTQHQEEGAFGFPNYNRFPAHDDVTHQQMWVDWIHRAYVGGLRVMVSLAVNNRTVAAAVMGPGDINGDDAASADIQIEQMKVLVSRHPWMEIAYTPEDLRRIVEDGHLAIILGVEIDNPGNMQWNPAVSSAGDLASQGIIRSELESLWDQGVRYVFPIHVVDNKFGGTAIYQDQFNMSNFHQTGSFWDIRCDEGHGITHQFEVAGFDLAYAIIKLKIGIDPFASPAPPPPCAAGGHANEKDLSALGTFAIEEMMRLGMMIDVDHMSTRSVESALALAETHDYPVNSGHDGPRFSSLANGNENERTDAQYGRISALGGMVGLGSTDRATNFVTNYHYVDDLVNPMQIAIGTDANGLVLLPGPDPAAPVTYDAAFPRLTDGLRTWDINVDGVANYGLFADYVRSWQNAGMTPGEHDAFFSTAEGFARMWERVEVARAAMIPTPPTAHAGGPYEVDEGSSVALDASATTDPNQTADSLTYEWDFDADGAHDDASGIAPMYAAGDGPAMVTVALLVTDDDAMTGTDSTTITVRNVAPAGTLTQLPPTVVFEGLTASFRFSDVTDPSSADMAAGFEYAADCTNDGVTDLAWSGSDTVTCAYPDAGIFTVRGLISDKDGGVGEASTSVTVLSTSDAFDAIAAMIEALRDGGSLNGGQSNALLVKLSHAKDLWQQGKTDKALRELDVLRRQVETFGRTGVLTSAESTQLVFWIDQLKASIVS